MDKDDPEATREPVLQAKGLVKRYGKVTAIASGDLELYPGEILAVIGDNGAGKTSLIKALCGRADPGRGRDPARRPSRCTSRARWTPAQAGIETVYQTLAVAPGLDIADNLFLGREERKPGVLGSVFRMLDKKHMKAEAARHMSELGVGTLQNIGQAVESLSGGQRQAVAVARSAAFGSKVVILDEPTAALGVKEGNRVLQLIRDVRDRGLPVILISHNMPHVFEVADRIHIQRLGRRATVITPQIAHHVRGGGHHDRRRGTAACGGLSTPPGTAGRFRDRSARPFRRSGSVVDPGHPPPALAGDEQQGGAVVEDDLHPGRRGGLRAPPAGRHRPRPRPADDGSGRAALDRDPGGRRGEQVGAVEPDRFVRGVVDERGQRLGRHGGRGRGGQAARPRRRRLPHRRRARGAVDR